MLKPKTVQVKTTLTTLQKLGATVAIANVGTYHQGKGGEMASCFEGRTTDIHVECHFITSVFNYWSHFFSLTPIC